MIVIPAVETGQFRHRRATWRQRRPTPAMRWASTRSTCRRRTKTTWSRCATRVARPWPTRASSRIGEIGLDFFIPMLCEPAMREKQEHFFREQLRIARDFDLPVLTHVRRSQDQVLKHVRQIRPPAASRMPSMAASSRRRAIIDLGFQARLRRRHDLYARLQIRRLATELPLDAIVLETDAPDISPGLDPPGPQQPRSNCRASAPCWPNCAAWHWPTWPLPPAPTRAPCMPRLPLME